MYKKNFLVVLIAMLALGLTSCGETLTSTTSDNGSSNSADNPSNNTENNSSSDSSSGGDNSSSDSGNGGDSSSSYSSSGGDNSSSDGGNGGDNSSSDGSDGGDNSSSDSNSGGDNSSSDSGSGGDNSSSDSSNSGDNSSSDGSNSGDAEQDSGNNSGSDQNGSQGTDTSNNDSKIDLVIQESKDGFCSVDGAIESKNSNYTDSGYSNTNNESGVTIKWKVKSTYGGQYAIVWRYANASANERSAKLNINDAEKATVSFPTTGAWNVWTSQQVNIELAQGDNLIALQATTSEGLADIDYIKITGDDIEAVDCTEKNAPVLSQDGNPVHRRYSSQRTRWDQSKADIILSYQYNNGGWPKNQSYNSAGNGGDGLGTIDNGATTSEMIYLAQVYRDTNTTKYRDAVRKGMDYLLEAQYDGGGWPQFYPLRGGYSDHVTFNDNAMSSVLTLLHHASEQHEPFDTDIFSDNDRAEMRQAIEDGVDYILKSQWRQDGTLTAWCAQHGKDDYLPKSARAYELESISGAESVEVIGFLMTQPQTPAIETAVKAAIDWFRSPDTYLADHTYDKSVEEKIVYKSGSRMWYRFYDLETNEGFFSDRDGGKYDDIMDISAERRNGYSWGGSYGEKILRYADDVGY